MPPALRLRACHKASNRRSRDRPPRFSRSPWWRYDRLRTRVRVSRGYGFCRLSRPFGKSQNRRNSNVDNA